jgi:large subunit ribosomal protein L34
MSKSTLNGSRLKALKVSGFRSRNSTKTGRTILKDRRKKGRWKLALSFKK